MCFCNLWLPILLSAAAVFVLSSLMWMVLPFHKGDFQKLGAEPEFHALLRQHRPGTGRYMVGFGDCGGGGGPRTPIDPDVPRALLLVQHGPLSMGRSLGAWGVHLVVVSVLVAYAGSLALGAGAAAMPVFRMTSLAALLAYGGGVVPKSIWDGVPWKSVPVALFDAAVYAAATGAIFAWRWPAA